MAQMVEHILGKDEVTGSIPVISSITLAQARVFCLCLIDNFYVLKFKEKNCFYVEMLKLLCYNDNIKNKLR